MESIEERLQANRYRHPLFNQASNPLDDLLKLLSRPRGRGRALPAPAPPLPRCAYNGASGRIGPLGWIAPVLAKPGEFHTVVISLHIKTEASLDSETNLAVISKMRDSTLPRS